jgi:hypothetical protein
MKKCMLMAVLCLAVAVTLPACSKDKASFSALEDARYTAKTNAEWNATKWRANGYEEWDIISRGDSSQVPECPQGDGWASVDLIAKDKKQVIQLKCSTVSPNIGCLVNNDFKTKPYAQEDGKCQATDKVPYPLPKIAK